MRHQPAPVYLDHIYATKHTYTRNATINIKYDGGSFTAERTRSITTNQQASFQSMRPSDIKVVIKYAVCISIVIQIHSSSKAQPSADSLFTAYSDFHLHTTFKNYYRYVENPDSILLLLSDPAHLKAKYGHKAWLPFEKHPKALLNGKESNMANYDQANYSVIKKLEGSVFCISITPPEKGFVISKSNRWINKNMVTHMSIERQKILAANNNTSFKESLAEYHFLISQDSVHDHAKIMLAKDKADLQRIVASGGIGMVMTLEGGHSLLGASAVGDKTALKKTYCDSACKAEITDNIKKLRSLPHKIFFITIAHMGWNKMIGNAKSLDKPGFRRGLLTAVTLSDDLRKSMFAKYGDGILGNIRSYSYIDTTVHTPDGKLKIKLPYSKDEFKSGIGYDVINELLDAKNNYADPIYVDCKHMDIKARFQYYDLVDSINKIKRASGKPTIPIIASHVGLSGKKRQVAIATAQYPLENSYEELIFGQTFYEVQLNERDLFWRNYTKLLKPADRAIYYPKNNQAESAGFNPFEGNVNYNTLGWFYPWEINFCDDEVKHIYESEGMIGLNLDKRILGDNMPNYTRRYKKFLRQKFRDIHGDVSYFLSDKTKISFEEYFTTEPLLRNIFRIIEVCGRTDATAWDHLALGSDFDGFIHPIASCPTAAHIPLFHKKMIEFTKIFVDIHNNRDLLYGLTTEAAMRKFFYTNGKDFILKNF